MSRAAFDTLLIANRGEIACRIARAARALGIRTVAVYSEPDAQSLHVTAADEAVMIGPAPAARSYLDVDKVLQVARDTGAGAVHPGYGFLSENPDFAARSEAAGLAFVGPTPAHIRAFGLKHEARRLAEESGVPLLPGSGLVNDAAAAEHEAARIGYPVMLKSTAGGGGIGMAVCRDAAELRARFASVERLARGNFSHAGVFVEKFVARARHVEVQVFGDGAGRVLALGERDCSSQRRNQKVIEETPAPNLTDAQRARLRDASLRLMQAVSYRSAGTVEFVLDADGGDSYFLEVNTRLQVEHCVTEEVFGVDLLGFMLRLAQGDRAMFDAALPAPRGHAIQARVYAEDPARDYQPSSGLLTEVRFAQDARVETWVETGVEVSAHYDPLIAKLIVHGETRDDAVQALARALAETRIAGIETNLPLLAQIAASESFAAGAMTTSTLASMAVAARGLEVQVAGVHTTVQDHPGRLGHWDVGIPPSGAMDALSLRLANRAVGNPEGAPGLEITVSGPTLRFRQPATIALTGATLDATLDAEPVPAHAPIEVAAGQTLRLGAVCEAGVRAYLSIRGGFDVPRYLGSAATFTLGGFGGHGGRALRVGDVLHVGDAAHAAPTRIPEAARPSLTRTWALTVMVGPHAAPDFFTPEDIETLFSASYEVHPQSSRTGVRLVGPRPTFARPDGGEAGLHPSNIHDNAYAIGAIDFTGDMPIILGPDGPSLGGFVCPATVIESDLWKLGQLRPGDQVRFVAVDDAEARARMAAQERQIATLDGLQSTGSSRGRRDAVLARVPAGAGSPGVTYRQAGDRNVLVEYGELVLDLTLRFRVHALMARLQRARIAGVRELTPGIRSLQVQYDPTRIGQHGLVDALQTLEADLGDVADFSVPTRVLHLPLSWDDPGARLAVEKYMSTVRSDAPWTPSNLEFIRRINGLDSEDDVRRIVYDARYLVLGLGDVYLGAPVATPLDPRHRLVTTKYNPARTWTPENAVGIGGAYMCIYGMEGPGGYQLVGRTIQVYNRFRATKLFDANAPWLLRFFDQIRFYPVSADELLELRRAFLAGRLDLDVREETFRVADYQKMLADEAPSIDAFRTRQRAAFAEERRRWDETGAARFTLEEPAAVDPFEADTDGARVAAHVPGSVWKVVTQEGARVSEGDPLVILESMKMEITVASPRGGRVARVLCREGQSIAAGQPLIALEG
ncbi:MAG: urea carboxylase [Polyangiales bacterium]